MEAGLDEDWLRAKKGVKMRMSDCGAMSVKVILDELGNGLRVPPAEFPVAYLAEKSGTTPQNVGSSFSPYIEKPLLAQGYVTAKRGNPVCIIIRR